MGMVGGGDGAFIGAVHRMAAALDGRIDLVCGAFSRDHDNCRRTGESLGLEADRCYERYSEMFAKEAARADGTKMECVSIVTPNHLHVPIAKAAIEAGFHVICDKPAGISFDEVVNLAKTVEQTGAHFALTHTYLGYPLVWQARHLAAQPEFGSIRKVLVEYPQGWLAGDAEKSGSKQAAWRVDPQYSGPAGAMGDIGSHAHSLVEFITGSRMDTVAARLRSHFDDRVLDDDGEVSFTLANGATGTLIASQVCVGEENSLSIRVYGEHSSLTWKQMEPNTLTERRADGLIRIHRPGTDKPLCDEALARCRLPSGHPEGYLEAFGNLYRDFANIIRTPTYSPTTPLPGIAEGLRGMAFLEAVVASSKNGAEWTELAPSPEFRGVLGALP
ncbi:Gfo/Idh/MocA family oxidoreductase [Pontixanthobacter sp. CEM42]|uniref:Gfo/Idh/MocA family protein n=1 Tax=Pontixanthobacter sp. CEM42 TaxID=2792077 RepID=UPI001ADFBB42|nr:Gfo/Idh/MocA family oxidoreductase [Pontixanthobacter sp. CEM42]